MSFLNPLFLIALVSVGIPLLIYLLNLRKPKRIRFSTLAFFDALKNTSLRKIKIKRWLLLALRTLAVAALALALANPYLPSGFGLLADGEPVIVGIILDNSPSMEQIDRNGPYVEQAREAASGIIDVHGSDDRFILNVSNGEPVSLPNLSKAAAGRELQELETKNAGNYLHERIEQVISQLESAPEPNKVLYIITDAQETQLNTLENIEQDEKIGVHTVLIKIGEAEPANAGIKEIKIGQSDRGYLLRAVVENFGSQPTGSQFFSFYLEGELLGQQTYNIEAGESVEFSFVVPETDKRFLKAEFHIEGDELSFDNRYHAAIQLPEQRRVLYIGKNDASNSGIRSYLRPLLEASAERSDRFLIEFETIEQVSPDRFEGADAIVLDGVESIPDYISQAVIENVQEGSGLLLLPAADGDIQSYNRLLGMSNVGRYSNLLGSYGSFERFDQLALPEEGHPITEDIFELQQGEELRVNLPELYYYYRINTVEGRASTPILRSQTGNIILNEAVVGNGTFIYSAIGSDPGWSNFPVKPLFAPLFFKTADYLASGEEAVLNQHTLGDLFETTIRNVPSGGVELRVDEDQIIPSTRQTFSGLNLFYEGVEWDDGWLYVRAGDREILYGLNQDTMESQLVALNIINIERLISAVFNSSEAFTLQNGQYQSVSEIKTASIGKEIWYWFIIAAIILLLTESMVSRHYKAETIS